MKKKIANVLRKWADRLAPIEVEYPLTYEEYKIEQLQLLQREKNIHLSDLPYLHRDMARKLADKMLEMGAINFKSTHTPDGLETIAKVYVGIKKQPCKSSFHTATYPKS